MQLTLFLNQDILAGLALFLLYFSFPTFFLTFLITISLSLSSPPLPGTTALYGEVSTMVSISAPGWAVSLHCAVLLGKKEVVLLFPLGDFC